MDTTFASAKEVAGSGASAFLRALCRNPLAIALAAIAGASPHDSFASSAFIVANCNDSGPGSLRNAVASATAPFNYDSVISFNLPAECNSTITLGTGSIPITSAGALTIQGPASRVAIHGTSDRILHVTSTGSFLLLSNLDLQDGYVLGGPGVGVTGGCISSSGIVELTASSVSGCYVHSAYGYGGGIWAAGGLRLYSSVVSNNRVDAGFAYGGGVYVVGPLSMRYSTVEGNVAIGDVYASGGGASVGEGGEITRSTISGNSVAGTTSTDAGLVFRSTPGSVLILLSTISGNSNYAGAGAGLRSEGRTYVYSSTIAFNYATVGTGSNSHIVSPGLAMTGGKLHIYNTVLSNNTYGFQGNDFSNEPSVTIAGSNNLVNAASGGLPAFGLVIGCARLGPLRDNGGQTWTHALLSGSPAIDKGAGSTPSGPVGDDQRLFPISPAGGAPDIGAYEVQQGDIVFNNGFDGCP